MRWSARPAALRIGLVAGAWVVVAALALAAGGRWESHGRTVGAGATRVVVFGIPHLGLSDLGPRTTPVLWRLLHTRAAIAATSIRSHDSRPSTAEGYATLGAGSRLAAPAGAGLAVAAGTAAGDTTAGALLATRTGRRPDGRIVVPAGVTVVRANIGRHIASRPGALGSALRRAGHATAVVSNADVRDLATGRWRLSRPAALALMDETLALSGGAVDRRLLDHRAVVAATLAALRSADAVVVDSGDMDRAAASVAQVLPATAAARRRVALSGTDRLLGTLLTRLPRGTLVLVTAVSPPPHGTLTPTIAIGPGVVRGTLSSPSTKRDGLVSLTDLAPTILDVLHVATPAGMVGHPLTVSPGAPVPALARLRAQDAAAAAQSRLVVPAIVIYTVAMGLLFLWLMVATLAGVPLPRRGVGFVALALAAAPLASYLVAIVPGATRASPGAAGGLVAAIAVAVAALCAAPRGRWPSALARVLALTVAVLVVDVVIGGPLHRATLLGFSGGGRFYGWPNTTFAVAGSAALLLCAILVDRFGRRADLLTGCAGGLAFVVLVDGAPSLGADVGGILALVPVYVLFMIVLVSGRLSRRALLWAGGGTALALALATGLDLLAPASARTDLADFVSGIAGDGPRGATTTIARKLSANVGFVGHSAWTWMLPELFVFAAWALGSAARRRLLIPAGSALRAGVLATGALALLGFLLNDSGPVVIALGLGFVGPLFAIVLAGRAPARPAARPARPARRGAVRARRPEHPRA